MLQVGLPTVNPSKYLKGRLRVYTHNDNNNLVMLSPQDAKILHQRKRMGGRLLGDDPEPGDDGDHHTHGEGGDDHDAAEWRSQKRGGQS